MVSSQIDGLYPFFLLLFICWFLRKVSKSLDCTWIFWVINAVLESLILLSPLPKCWHYKHVLYIPSTIFSSIYLTTQALRYLVVKFLFYFILLWGIGKWHMVAVSIKVSWQTSEDKVMLGWTWPFLLGYAWWLLYFCECSLNPWVCIWFQDIFKYLTDLSIDIC